MLQFHCTSALGVRVTIKERLFVYRERDRDKRRLNDWAKRNKLRLLLQRHY